MGKLRAQCRQPPPPLNKYSGKAYTIAIILIASFSMAPLDFFHIPIGFAKLVSEGLAWAILGRALQIRIQKGEKLFLQYEIILPLVILGFIGAIGSIFSGNGALGGNLFIRNTLSFLPLFVAIQNLHLSNQERQWLGRILIVLFLIQLPVSWLKAFTLGIDESFWIGTLHNQAGEFGLLLPLFAISALTSLYVFFNPSIIYRGTILALILGFGLFGVIAEKRAVVFMVPIWIWLTFGLYLFWHKHRKVDRSSPPAIRLTTILEQIISLSIVSILIIWCSLTFISSLNPEEKIDGIPSVEHLIDYTIGYLFRDYAHSLNNPVENIEQDRSIQMGRFRLIIESLRLTAASNFTTMLFGFGGSAISTSYILGKERSDIMFEKFKIRGPTAGITRVILETGFIGLLLMLAWFTTVGMYLFRKFLHETNPDKAVGCLAIFLIHSVFLYDFLFYSNASWMFGVLSPTYFLLIAFHLKTPINRDDFRLELY